MRRGTGIAAGIIVVLLLVGTAIGGYNWGVQEGLERSGDAVEVVRYWGHGFGFPFGLLFFPLLLLAVFAFRGFGWRRWDHDHGPGGPGAHGPGGHGRWEQGFEDWHRRQHEAGGGSSGSGGQPA